MVSLTDLPSRRQTCAAIFKTVSVVKNNFPTLFAFVQPLTTPHFLGNQWWWLWYSNRNVILASIFPLVNCPVTYRWSVHLKQFVKITFFALWFHCFIPRSLIKVIIYLNREIEINITRFENILLSTLDIHQNVPREMCIMSSLSKFYLDYPTVNRHVKFWINFLGSSIFL